MRSAAHGLGEDREYECVNRLSRLLTALSVGVAILVALLTYSMRVARADAPAWLQWLAFDHSAILALIALISSVVAAVVELVRSYVASRHYRRAILAKLLNDFSREMFRDRARNNRVTLFRATDGWRVWLWTIWRLPIFGKLHKWRALLGVKPHARYLNAYLRPMAVRNQVSTAAFRISDVFEECEGVAGLVWESGSVALKDLPIIDRATIRALSALKDLPADHPVAKYSAGTNITDVSLLKSCDTYARHFLGTVISASDGTPWGVLLLDSQDDQCPFFQDGELSEPYVNRFNDCARYLGKIVG